MTIHQYPATALLHCVQCEHDVLEYKEASDSSDDDGEFRCVRCNSCYAVRSGVPVFTPAQNENSEQWKVWNDHLTGFGARRAGRESKPSQSQLDRWQRKARTFGDFVGANDGRLLDVGCGPGTFRQSLSDNIEYVGIDPLPKRADGFLFVQALAEKIPFRADSFDFVLVRSALDHFCELDAFFVDAARVLKPDGKLLIEQAVHEVTGPLSAIKYVAHEAKDFLDDLQRKEEANSAPKHINDFTTKTLFGSIPPNFEVARVKRYDPKWYLATQVMLEINPPSLAGQ